MVGVKARSARERVVVMWEVGMIGSGNVRSWNDWLGSVLVWVAVMHEET